MKGIVFTLLADMVEEVYGLDAWDKVLTESGHDGLYISTETYPDQELFDLVSAAESISGVPAADLIKAFGKYSFPKFRDQNPEFCRPGMTLKEFLLTVDRVIHVEVRKLHPDASLPHFKYEEESDNQLTMYYESPRKLCMLAEGLIAGAAEHFHTSYTLIHDECMHEGAERCALHLTMHSLN